MFLQYKNEIVNLESAAYRRLSDASNKSETDSFIKQKLKEKFGIDKSPWDKINEVLEKYKFQHRIEEPKGDMYEPSFKGGIKYKDLSDGEKVIFHLICSSYGGKGGIKGKTKLILLDEFDAHLNPMMSKMFIEIVQDILVKQFGIQVIMTTHSPSTIAYCEEVGLFWMESGKIEKIDKHSTIERLTPGILTFRAEKLLLLTNKNTIIFTEGETDILYIRSAIKKLGNAQNLFHSILKKAEFISAQGDKGKDFLQIFRNARSSKTVIGLFDFDKKGIEAFNSFNKEITYDNVKNWKNTIFSDKNIAAILIPANNQEYSDMAEFGYFPIEFLFTKKDIAAFKNDYLVQQTTEQMASKYFSQKSTINQALSFTQEDKIDFAEYIERNSESIDFSNFTELLTTLAKITIPVT